MTGEETNSNRDNNSSPARGHRSYGWMIVLAVVLLLVLSVRQFCVGSYQISTDAMGESLHPGDYVLVNKLPLKGNPGRNRVVLFTSPLLKDSASQPLFLSRCIGMPGDTILISGEGYEVNGKRLPHSPQSLNTYFITQEGITDFLKALQKLDIPVRDRKEELFGLSLSLTTFEEYQLREELTDEQNIHFIRSQSAPYKLVVPRKGRAYRLDKTTITACKEAILAEEGDKAQFRDGKLYLDGRETTFFFFDQDYYWMLSDNVNESVDSRHLGFIPRDHIIGNVWFCWFSPDKQRILKPVD